MSEDLPAPTLLAVQPAGSVFAGERYHFTAEFDGVVNVAGTVVATIGYGDHQDTVTNVDVTVAGNVVSFDYTVPATVGEGIMTVRMRRDGDE